MNRLQKNFPNTLTCLNILSGCVAIVFAFHADTPYGSLAGWQLSCIAIGVATVADFLDGFMARLLHAYSDLGKQLDSLSDLVSFGVAPSMLLINVADSFTSIPQWALWIPLLIPIAGALRLARFNIDTRQETGFIGLPIPANAIFWIGWCALIAKGYSFAGNLYVFIIAVILLAWLMTSNLRLISLKFHNYRLKTNLRRWILIGGAAILLCIFGLQSFCLIIALYLLLSIKF